MISTVFEVGSEDRFSLVLHTGGAAWEAGFDVEISSAGDCAYIIHPGFNNGRLLSQKFQFKLGHDRMERLIGVIREVGFFKLKELYSDPNTAGCLRRYIKVVLEGQSHIVNTKTCNQVKPVEDIIEAINACIPPNCPPIRQQ